MAKLLTLLSLTAVSGASAQLDGLGGDDLFKQPRNCPVFKCSKGEKPVQKSVAKKENRIFSYGCDQSAFNMFSSFDASDLENLGKGGLPKKNSHGDRVQKCCEARDICFQTCGMSKKMCENDYDTCIAKKCKGDKNCNMQANFALAMGDIGGGGTGGAGAKTTKGGFEVADPKCMEYLQFQEDRCECVPEANLTNRFADSLWNFYKKYAPKKLEEPTKVDVKKEVPQDGDAESWLEETVYSKSFKKGQEAKIFSALFAKYKDKAVARKTRPKPSYPDYKDDYLKDDLYKGDDLYKNKDLPKADAKPKKEKKQPKKEEPKKAEPKEDEGFANWSGEEEVVEEEL